jgi:hypothetical protein
MRGRSITGTPAGKTSLRPNMNPTMQEGSGGDYNALCAKPPSLEGLDTENLLIIRCQNETRHGALNGLESWLQFEE